MKVSFHDFDGSYELYLEAESVEEAALLMRFSINAKREPPDVIGHVSGKDIACDIWFKRRGDWTNKVERRS